LNTSSCRYRTFDFAPVALALLCVFGGGCSGGEPCQADASGLDASTVVFAAMTSGGLETSSESEFFWSRHGTYAAYVFGDGRFVMLDESTVSTLGYRTYREGHIPVGTLEQMLCHSAGLSTGDGIGYGLCGVIDGGEQIVSVNLPDLEMVASAGTTFEGFAECQDDDPTNPVPSADLVALANLLFSLPDFETTEIVSEKIMLGGYRTSGGESSPCTTETAVDWPFTDIELPESDGPWSVKVDSPLAGDVRTFLRGNLIDSRLFLYRMACVVSDGVLSYVYYDDMPADEDLFPF